MAGFKPNRKIYRLVFDDPDLAGLEVRAKSVPLGQFMALTELVDLQDGGGRGVSAADVKAIDDLFTGFADALLSWNVLDDNDQPVPADKAGLFTQEFDFVLSIITAWMDAVAGVSAPLAPASSNGGTSLEASMPMVPLSGNPES